MTVLAIERKQKRIEKALQKGTVHPDNPVAYAMQAQYRHLEQLKQQI